MSQPRSRSHRGWVQLAQTPSGVGEREAMWYSPKYIFMGPLFTRLVARKLKNWNTSRVQLAISQ